MSSDEERPEPSGCGFGIALALAVCGALALPAYGVMSVFRSDVCEPDSAAYFCSGAGQNMAVSIGMVAGPGALAAGLVAALVSRRVRPFWPYLVVIAQIVGLAVISSVSSRVS